MGRTAIIIKVGDQKINAAKMHYRLREGSIVDIIDEDNPIWGGKTLEQIISTDMAKIFAIAEINPTFLPEIMKSFVPIGLAIDTRKKGDGQLYVPDKTIFRPRCKVLQLSDLATKLGDASLVEKWRGSETVPFANLTDLNVQDFTAAGDLSADVIGDRNAITSGSANIGSGETYTTITSALADIGNLTGNLTFTVTSNTSETLNWTATAENLNGYTLKFTADAYHAGVLNAGRKASMTGNGRIFLLEVEGSGGVIIEKLECTKTDARAASKFICVEDVVTGWSGEFSYLICDGQDSLDCLIEINDAQVSADVWGCGCYDIHFYSFSYDALAGGSICENCTSRDSNGSGFYGGGGANCTIRNCAAVDSGWNSDFDTIGSATGYNNASSDDTGDDGNWGTGSGNIDITNADFSDSTWQIDNTSNLYQAGANPAIEPNEEYVNSVAIETDDVDIGCWGIERAGGIQILRRRMEGE